MYGYLNQKRLSSDYMVIAKSKDIGRLPSFLAQGGLVQATSLRGGSRTRLALSYLEASVVTASGPESEPADPPPPLYASDVAEKKTGGAFYLWVADEGVLYAEALHERWKIPLYRLLMVKVPEAGEVWRVGLEAVQTGLFGWVFLRASRACGTAQLRKLQLCAEKARCRVFLLNESKLPHWTLKASIEAEDDTNPVLEELRYSSFLRRGLLPLDAKSCHGRSA